MPHHPNSRLAWHDVPLPGLHACLTWQLNVTIHPPLNSGKFVSILRDPDAQVELSRAGSGLLADVQLMRGLDVHLLDSLTILKHLANIPAAPKD